jgi:hypothetical protein
MRPRSARASLTEAIRTASPSPTGASAAGWSARGLTDTTNSPPFSMRTARSAATSFATQPKTLRHAPIV